MPLINAFLKEDYERSLELICDIVFNSNFPDKEIEKEKLIILDEINSYKDSPADLIFDDFEEIIFKGATIGRNILGNKRDLRIKVDKELIQNKIKTVGAKYFETSAKLNENVDKALESLSVQILNTFK